MLALVSADYVEYSPVWRFFGGSLSTESFADWITADSSADSAFPGCGKPNVAGGLAIFNQLKRDIVTPVVNTLLVTEAVNLSPYTYSKTTGEPPATHRSAPQIL